VLHPDDELDPEGVEFSAALPPLPDPLEPPELELEGADPDDAVPPDEVGDPEEDVAMPPEEEVVADPEEEPVAPPEEEAVEAPEEEVPLPPDEEVEAPEEEDADDPEEDEEVEAPEDELLRPPEELLAPPLLPASGVPAPLELLASPAPASIGPPTGVMITCQPSVALVLAIEIVIWPFVIGTSADETVSVAVTTVLLLTHGVCSTVAWTVDPK
jgi:hypothetical protein